MILNFVYRNHKERIDERHVVPKAIIFEPDPPSDYNYQPGWFLQTHDIDKNAPRNFAFTNIIPTKDRLVLVDFTQLHERESIQSLLNAAKDLVLSIENDNSQHGDIVSQDTLKNVSILRQILEFYAK
jgi:predicted DNA-binding transcriptional regulator YafY